jgi:regulator of protease activity HflC (stomatin/prohibitin superfamily)
MSSLLLKVVLPLLIIVPGVFWVVRGKIARKDRYGSEAQTVNVRPYAIGVVVLGLLVWLLTSFAVVAGGQLAVRVAPGSNVSTFTGAGYVPPFTKVVKFDRRGSVDTKVCLNANDQVEESCADAIIVTGVDGGKLFVDIDMVYALDNPCPSAPQRGCIDENVRGKLVSNYLSFKSDAGLKKQIRNVAKDALGEVVSEYTAVGVLTESRVEVQTKAQDLVTRRLEEKLGVRVITLNFLEIRSTVAVEKAVEEKQAKVQAVEIANLAVQEQEKINEKNISAAQSDAKVKVIGAEAEAQANKILSGSLDENILTSRWIDAIGKSGTVITDGKIPTIVNPK